MQQAERAIFDLRRGQPIRVSSGGDQPDVVAMAVETLTPAMLDHLRTLAPGGHPALIITPNRARALGMEPGNAPAIRLPLRDDVAVADVQSLATVVCEHEHHRASADLEPADEAEYAALHLARAGKLLPAVVTIAVPAGDSDTVDRLQADGTILGVDATPALAVAASPQLEMAHVSDASVPLEDADNTRFILFREANGLLEHIAVLIGDQDQWPDPLPIRMHSSCLTGDLFGSLRCDCGEQLRNSVRTIDQAGGGILLYLAQEGRGIGLANKLRAYTLQDSGMDTVEADCSLGFGSDERRYEAAVEMLQHLRINRVSLLTNNPLKIEALEDGGITVVERQPLHGSLNPHNVRYLNTKAERAGHWLDELLSRALPGK
ncbi:GTP cyclohydrolase II RibA [Aquisalimonas sp.]|uniref:GTP cyclohydrolase II RibA n=1 Tax=unclassified Aquisalimonas TaxID=2644645 RepID=UPI0025BA4DCA|nr:GTP cyclohydrolase II RibA [Aquisalimonas sp.]